MSSGICQDCCTDLEHTLLSRVKDTHPGHQLPLFRRFLDLAVLGFLQCVVQLATVWSHVLTVRLKLLGIHGSAFSSS